jgi:O-antigen ligase
LTVRAQAAQIGARFARLPQGLAPLLALSILAAAIGGITAVFPAGILIPFAGIIIFALIRSASWRMTFVVVGATVTLNTSDQLGLPKVVYLSGVALALVAALSQVNTRRSEEIAPWRKLWPGSVALFLVVALSFIIGVSMGNSATFWLRDAAPYLLFAGVPLLARDASKVPRRLLISMFVISGTLAAVAFAAEFLDRRHYADLAFHRVVFQSVLLPAALFCYATAQAFTKNKHRALWIATAASILACLLVTGTRTVLLLLVGPLALMVAYGSQLFRLVPRLILYFGGGLIVLLAAIQGFVFIVGGDLQKPTDRLASITATIANPMSDSSYRERVEQTEEAWNVFLGNPLFGVGPGHLFEGRSPTDARILTFNIDSPAAFAAKFGLVGIAALLVVAIGYGLFIKGLPPRDAVASRAALIAYSAVVLAMATLLSPFEDKGLSFGLFFLLALSGSGRGVPARSPTRITREFPLQVKRATFEPTGRVGS